MQYLSTRSKSERKLRKCKLALDVSGSIEEIMIYDWITVTELKQEISKILGVPSSHQKIFFGHIELKNSRTLEDYNIFNSINSDFRTKSLYVQLIQKSGSYIQPCPGSYSKNSVIADAHEGLALGLSPVLALDGTGGTYFMKTARKTIGSVFKPFDEEAYAPMNPKNYSGKLGEIGLRPGVLSGESAYREVAAYLLDSSHFSSVPSTVLAQAQHPSFNYAMGEIYPKTGSLQEFIVNSGTIDDYSSSIFSVDEIQKICILDIRILNMDRNEGNILVVKNKEDFQLVPIDHGLSIPDNFEISDFDLCWMNWSQAKEPISPKAYEYIESLNPLADIQNLQESMPFRDKCLRNIRISTLLLKKGCKAGLSLHNIGCLLYRKGCSDSLSTVEKIVSDAYDLYKTINKNLSSRLKLEKFLCDSQKNVRKRPRALSSNEIEFEAFLPSPQSLNSTQHTDNDNLFDTVVTISEVSEEEDFSDFENYDLDESTNNLNLSFSSSFSRSETVIDSPEENEAFNTKLFYYIEAFMDLAIQKKAKELLSNFYLENENPKGRTRSCSNALL